MSDRLLQDMTYMLVTDNNQRL